MNYSVKFWDRIAERYAKKPVPDEAIYQAKLKHTRDYLKPDMRALEFGCGTGSTALALAPHVASYQAIDVSPGMIDIAQRKLKDQPIDELSFAVSPLETFDAADESFDAVLGMSILHLLDDPQSAIQDVYRMLKPGGVFISSTACLGDNLAFFRFIGPIGSWLGVIPRVQVFSREELRHKLTGTGFKLEYEMELGPKSHVCFLIASKPVSPTP